MPVEPPAADHAAPSGLSVLSRGCPDPLAKVYDVALLDLDGVVYLGGAAVPDAPDALAKASDAGMRLAFVTNNSSRTPSAIAAQLASFGVPASARDVVTSAQATARLLATRLPAGAAVLVVGGHRPPRAPRGRGLRPGTVPAGPPPPALPGPPHQRPPYRAASWTGLLEPHPPVSMSGAAFRCGGWAARWLAGGRLVLDGSGDMIDGLRALCAAAWSTGNVTPDAARHALAALKG